MLRLCTDDLDQEDKIKRVSFRRQPDVVSCNELFQRLRRELGVWQRLHHENVLPLYGTTDDFSPLTSMVCPWLEKGNVRKHLELVGDILTVSDRLQIVSSLSWPV